MKIRRNVLKKRADSTSRLVTELDEQSTTAEVSHRVMSQNDQHQILTLGHDIGVFQ